MLNRELTNLVITEEGIRNINYLLTKLVNESSSKCAILVEKSGQMIAGQGDINNIDTMALAALSAGAFASTRAIARLIGEKEFKIMFQQGQRDSIFISLLGTEDILIVVFDSRTTAGLVKLKTEQAVSGVTGEMQTMKSSRAPNGGGAPLGEAKTFIDDELDSLFSE